MNKPLSLTDSEGGKVTPLARPSPFHHMRSFLGLLFLVCICWWCVEAQTPAAPSAARTVGDIVSVDAAAKTLQIRTATGVTWTVTLTDKTVCATLPAGETDMKKATPIALSDVKPGDRALARGEQGQGENTIVARTVVVMTKSELAEKQARERADWMRRSVAGTVTAVDPSQDTITMSTQSREGAKTVTVQVSAATQYRRYAPDSVKFADALPSRLADIQAGDQVRALGDKNGDGTRVTAEQIVSGAFRTFAGTVIAADASAGTVQVTDLQTNKPVTVHVKQETLERRLPEWAAMMLARRLGGGGPGGPGAAGGAPGGAPGGAGQWQRPAGGGAGGSGGAGQWQQRSGAGGSGGAGGWQGGGGGNGGPGGPGAPGGGRGQFDMQQMLERMPAFTLADLKKGDALVISSSRGVKTGDVTAFTLLAGVEPLLMAATRVAGGGSVNAGSWNLDIGMPGMPTE